MLNTIMLRLASKRTTTVIVRQISSKDSEKRSYKLVIVGGGSGGITMAAKFARILGPGQVAVIEPRTVHCYQPLWTLVGGGLKRLEESKRPMSDVMPKGVKWINEGVVSFMPQTNTVETNKGQKIGYEYLIVSMGLVLEFEKIKGLPEAFDTPGVCSNYSYETVTKTIEALRNFQGGTAIFTQPNTPIKCAGAPQKAMYLSDAFIRKAGKRENTKIMFNSGMGSIFSAPIYAASLTKVAKTKDIQVNLNTNLVEIRPETREAIFERVDSKEILKELIIFKYDMIHVSPPMSPPKELRESCLVDKSTGFLTVNKHTLQHTVYPNIFGIGDCTNLPTSKTAAAIASQSGVLKDNLSSLMKGKNLSAKYDGYTSCPLVTSFNSCILAEFDYNLEPLETLPIDQSKERWISYRLKKDLMAPLYWNLLLKGYWNGPKIVRKLLHLGIGK